MPRWNVTPLPGAVSESVDSTLPMLLVQIEASSYDDAIQQGQAVYFLQGYKFPKSKLAAAKDEGPLPSWNVYLKTGPLVTYPSIDEEEALKRLAKMCDEWGLSTDSFVLERVEDCKVTLWEVYDRLSKNTTGPFGSEEWAEAARQDLQLKYIGSDFEVRRVQE